MDEDTSAERALLEAVAAATGVSSDLYVKLCNVAKEAREHRELLEFVTDPAFILRTHAAFTFLKQRVKEQEERCQRLEAECAALKERLGLPRREGLRKRARSEP